MSGRDGAGDDFGDALENDTPAFATGAGRSSSRRTAGNVGDAGSKAPQLMALKSNSQDLTKGPKFKDDKGVKFSVVPNGSAEQSEYFGSYFQRVSSKDRRGCYDALDVSETTGECVGVAGGENVLRVMRTYTRKNQRSAMVPGCLARVRR